MRWGEGGGNRRTGKVRELGLVHKIKKKFVLKKKKIQLLCDGLRDLKNRYKLSLLLFQFASNAYNKDLAKGKLREEIIYFSLQVMWSIINGGQGRNLEVRTEAETTG